MLRTTANAANGETTRSLTKVFFAGEWRVIYDTKHPNEPFALYHRSRDMQTLRVHSRLIGRYRLHSQALAVIGGEMQEIGL